MAFSDFDRMLHAAAANKILHQSQFNENPMKSFDTSAKIIQHSSLNKGKSLFKLSDPELFSTHLTHNLEKLSDGPLFLSDLNPFSPPHPSEKLEKMTASQAAQGKGKALRWDQMVDTLSALSHADQEDFEVGGALEGGRRRRLAREVLELLQEVLQIEQETLDIATFF